MSNEWSDKPGCTMPVLEQNTWISQSVAQQLDCDNLLVETNVSDNEMPTDSQASTLTVPLPSPVNFHENDVFYGPVFMPQNHTDVKDVKAEHGICGLKNLGNTCFMNAGLQCLIANSRLVRYFTSTELVHSHTPTNKFSEILHKVWSGEYCTLNTSDFKDTVALYHPQFKDFRQHDCQEFLALLLDSLHEQLNVRKPANHSCGVTTNEIQSGETEMKASCLNNQWTLSDHQSSVTTGEEIMKKGKRSLDLQDSEILASTMSTDVTKSQSEDSNQSESSVHSSVSVGLNHRTDVIAEKIECFSEQMTEVMPVCDRRIPTIEDICMKNNKVLNTNVLVDHVDQVTVDSDKYQKVENTEDTASSMDTLLQYDTQKQSTFKALKETNLLANQKDKYTTDGYSKKLFSQCGDQDTDCSINKIKRIKIDEEEKNVRRQQLLKMNKEVENFNLVDDQRLKQLTPQISQKASVRSPTAACRVSPSQTTFNNDIWSTYILEADTQWKNYKDSNQSVVVDTFQGQFKSTVVCSECHHVSVTFEPFMYLSVPLPHAMERQISVIFVACDNKQPIRYLLTLNKTDKIVMLKTALRHLIKEESCDLHIAEVLSNHISRILEDNVLLKYVNDENRKIYAFEMLPAPSGSESGKVTRPALQANRDNNDLFTSPDGSAMSASLNNSLEKLVSSSSDELLNNCVRSNPPSTHTNLELRRDVDWQTNLLTDQTCSSSIAPQDGSEEVITECADVVDRWRSCAICLEEMTDSDLMIHAVCGGTLCHTCLDMSFKHYGEAAFVCPVCTVTVSPKEDFIQVNLVADYKPKTRILSVPVILRNQHTNDCGQTERSLFGHPNLVYLPSEIAGEVLYNHVDRVVPVLTQYHIVLTDGQGLRCSRCLYTDHCSGCQVNRESESITLQPGDHLTVCFNSLDRDHVQNSASHMDHESTRELRSSQPLSLYDCFTAFTQCEVLDEHNPWYCPHCCKNQCAHKTMTVWRYPQTLIVYLKRFVFHELTSTKIDKKVVFPLDDLDLSEYMSGPRTHSLLYTLQSCICHFGGVSSGHYTAYAKHSVNNKWVYYNDETTVEKAPEEEDYSHAYVLFYQRQDAQGSESDIKLRRKLSEDRQMEEAVDIERAGQSTHTVQGAGKSGH